MRKDVYGRPAESLNYGRDEFTAVEWDDTTTEGVIYRFLVTEETKIGLNKFSRIT